MKKKLPPIGPQIVDGTNMVSPLNRFRHKKTGGIYRVITVARREADLEPVVVYRSIYGGDAWDRPLTEWLDGRFEVVR